MSIEAEAVLVARQFEDPTLYAWIELREKHFHAFVNDPQIFYSSVITDFFTDVIIAFIVPSIEPFVRLSNRR